MLRWSARTAGICVAALVSAQFCCAQSASAEDDKSTLHVYVNLVQIPVLVLNSSLRPVQHIPDSNFKVAIDGLGQIHPARIRMEGEDPINLTLIVDRSVRDDTLWNDLPKSLEPLIQLLRPRDHISVLGMDGCTARRIGAEMAPFDADWLRLSARTVTDMVPFKAHGKKEVCVRPITYWELVTYAAKKLSQLPGRKILVTLGPGDKLSTQMAQQVHALLTGSSITLFPLVHGPMVNGFVLPRGFDTDALQAMANQAELSGGIMLGTSYRGFGKTLAQPIELARGRYIIEFPRPEKLSSGTHYIQVADGHPRDFIRAAGISVPVAGPNEKQDPAVEHGPLMATEASAADNDATSHEVAQGSGMENPSAAMVPPPPALPVVAPVPAVPDAAKPTAPKSPQPDPTDITGDLRPSH